MQILELEKNEDMALAKVKGKDGIYMVTIEVDSIRCTCQQFIYSRGKIPCKHIEAVLSGLISQ